METIGTILAGGRSTRFGSAKCSAELGGLTLIERVLRAQKEVFDEVIVITNDPEPLAGLGARLVPDSAGISGPLAGIHAALSYADGRAIALAPCDAPFVVPTFYRLLLRSTGDADAVFPRSRGPLGFEPLFGWIGPDALPPLETFLQATGDAVHHFIDTLPRVRYLPLDEIDALEGSSPLFMNINTPEDMQRAERFLPDTTRP